MLEKAGKKIKSTKTHIDVGECYRGCKKKTKENGGPGGGGRGQLL